MKALLQKIRARKNISVLSLHIPSISQTQAAEKTIHTPVATRYIPLPNRAYTPAIISVNSGHVLALTLSPML